MSTSILVGNVIVCALLIEWIWRGAERLSTAPGFSEGERQTLLRYRRFRWATVVIAALVVGTAIVSWQRNSLSMLSLTFLVAIVTYTLLGQTSFVLRYVIRRRTEQR